MAEPSPEHRGDRESRPPAGRPRWVKAVVIGAVLLLAVVVVLHLTGNGVGPGNHLP